jgi:CRISPR-associated helicase Cas3
MGERSGTPGLFVALPTMATADQMYRRVARYARRCLDTPAGLTLAHSMAWLNEEYTADTASLGELVDDTDPCHAEPSRTAAAEWLHGRNRTLLAPLSVGTIDQVLAAVVKGRHNALRLLGLSGKVLVVDEVHSYDAYMHALLRRLLHWLGVLRVPVVLLSATLTGQTARQLVQDYLEGTGAGGRELPTAPYPGWVYADAATGHTVADTVAVEHPWELAVDLHPVSSGNDDVPTGRWAVLGKLLEPVTASGGCAAVVCNTVVDAQNTYRALRSWFDELPSPPELHLLHARFPAWRRAEITTAVEQRFGKKRPTNGAAVLVATQIVEQSLDLDFDLLISDLAPLALLFQRAGRCWRHHDRAGRPGWSTGPRLVVLTPTGSEGRLSVPVRWSGVYAPSLLMRTHELLDRLAGPVAVPGQVQDLVDAVYEEVFVDTDDPDRLWKADMERWGADAAAEGVADMATVPPLSGMNSLADWSAGEIDEELLVTRFGADSVRVVCCYLDEHGNRWLDADRHAARLPEQGSGPAGRFTPNQVRAIMANTVPVRSGQWLRDLGPEHQPPEPWARNPLLRRLTLLPLSQGPGGEEQARVGKNEWRVSESVGLQIAPCS